MATDYLKYMMYLTVRSFDAKSTWEKGGLVSPLDIPIDNLQRLSPNTAGT